MYTLSFWCWFCHLEAYLFRNYYLLSFLTDVLWFKTLSSFLRMHESFDYKTFYWSLDIDWLFFANGGIASKEPEDISIFPPPVFIFLQQYSLCQYSFWYHYLVSLPFFSHLKPDRGKPILEAHYYFFVIIIIVNIFYWSKSFRKYKPSYIT